MARKIPKIPFGTTITARMHNKVDPCYQAKAEVRKAAAIVGQVLVHFGAGYGTTTTQIFATPADIATFHDLLLQSTMTAIKNGKLNWDVDQPTRDLVCTAAFAHGALAKQQAGSAPLTITVILDTLREIQNTICPPGAGGGPVCTF